MTANELTRNILHFLILEGCQAERINNIARRIGNRFVKSNMTRGTADIHAIIKGKAIKIEVKIGKDKQSKYQKVYQQEVEKAGGIYYIAKDFDSFYEWYNKMFAV
jgi:hypothetical protein